jgi:hypothetical protein
MGQAQFFGSNEETRLVQALARSPAQSALVPLVVGRPKSFGLN